MRSRPTSPRLQRTALAGGLVAAILATSFEAAAQPKACADALGEGQKLAQSGKLVSARQRLAACAKPTCAAAVRNACARKRDEVERAVPTATVVVRDEAGNDIEAPLTLDGAPFHPSPGRAEPIDPGPHVIVLQQPGARPIEVKVTINEGEKSRVIVLTATKEPPEPPPPPPPPPSPAPVDDLAEARATIAAAEAAPPALRRGKAKSSSSMPWVLGITGGAAIVTGGVFVLVSVSERSKADDLTALAARSQNATEKDDLQSSADDKSRSADRNLMIGAIVGGAGVLFLGTGVLWAIARSGGDSDADALSAKVRVVPLVGPLPGAAVTGTF